VAVETLPTVPSPSVPTGLTGRRVARLAVLANTNLSIIGARLADLRHRQFPAAVALQPDVAVILAGMNDTLRSDFNPVALRNDLDVTVAALQVRGAVVLITRFHDHGRVFRLPGPLRRALHLRVGQLNDATDDVVARRDALCLDLAPVSGAYDHAAWRWTG
jgi:lysophospholipase L1-like esterase